MRARLRLLGVAAVLAVVTTTAAASGVTGIRADELPEPNDPCDSDIFIPYVAAGDGVVAGDKDTDGGESVSDDKRYSELLAAKMVKDHFPYCLFNVSQGSTSTSDYQDEDIEGFTQQSKIHDLKPRLVTLQLGRENNPIVQHIDLCLDQIKDHQFIQASACAGLILAAEPAWEELNDRLDEILAQYEVDMAGNPEMVVAVLGYFNPYPSATDVATHIPGLCTDLVDTMPTCTIRWVMLPPVLVLMDQIVKKLNTTIEGVVKKYQIATQGHYFFVNPYEKFKDHCTKMKVAIQTTVYHPTNTVEPHNSDEDFGCSDTWIKSDGDAGTMTPFPYLAPAATGVLLTAFQQTTEMGAFPNEDGHKCLADLIYEADNGWGSLKNMLDIPEPPEDPCP